MLSLVNGCKLVNTTQHTAETLNGREQGGPEFKRAVRDYVRAYVWRHGRSKIAEDLGVSRHIALSSLVTASLIIEAGGGLADAGEWSTLAVLFGKAVYGLMPYAMLAILLSVLTSSSSMGIAFSLAYFFAELIVFLTVGGLFDWFSNVADFLLGPSVTAWMIETGIHTANPPRTLFPLKDPPSELHAFLVVTAYMVIACAAAVWLFQRKDIAGARGE